MFYLIPDIYIDAGSYNGVPSSGVVFTMRFSRWLKDHLDTNRAAIGVCNGVVAIDINDPVTLLAFQALDNVPAVVAQ